MFYLTKTPWLLKKYYPDCVWNKSRSENKIYLTFDDGPHPEATLYALDKLKIYNAKATFFCIGKNVVQYPKIYKRILEEGHRVGNHTHNHLNGWQVSDEAYFKNIREAAKYIDSDLFRPPYGKISRFQVTGLRRPSINYKIIMWDVLSADFDQKITPEKCISNVKKNTKNGSIIVFHDSEKAFERMRKALPDILDYFSNQGLQMEAIR